MTQHSWTWLGLLCGVVACGGDDPAAPNFGSGGTVADGGAGAEPGAGGSPSPASGGVAGTASGGAPGVGGMPMGGMPSTGGSPASGGAIGMGGMTGMGGSGAVPGTGGTGAGGDGTGGGSGDGTCCPDGDCLCHGPDPSDLTSANGPYSTDSYDLRGTGCVYYPTNTEGPFAAVAISDGLAGTGGCGRTQTDGWGPLYASHGIVAMIVETGSGDQPAQRGAALLEGIAGFKAENQNNGSPLFGKLAGRYGTSGFSMGGGGTTRAATDDPSLLSSVGVMAWSPVGTGVTVPTLFICGSTDRLAGCGSHGTPAYNAMPDSTPKMIATVSSGHVGQPTAGGGTSGAIGLAFQKVFLEGDERWRPILLSADYDDTTIQ